MGKRQVSQTSHLKKKLRVGSKLLIVMNNNGTIRSIMRFKSASGGFAVDDITDETQQALGIEIKNNNWSPARVAEMISTRLYPSVGSYAIDH